MQFKEIDCNVDSIPSLFNFVDDWYDLAAMTDIQPKTFSYVLRNKKTVKPGSDDSVYKIWREKDRIGFYSTGPLKFIQERLLLFLNGIISMIPQDHLDCIWAYMPGVVVTKKIKEFESRKYLIKADIVKYYDTISFNHIKKVLMHYGFNELGAKLVTRFLTVRKPGLEKGPVTLQQGSKASPMVSNLVGYHYFDKPLLTWIDEQRKIYPKINIKYCRYCDNFAVSLDGEIPIDFIKDFRIKLRDVVWRAGFKYHKWSVTPINHPKVNQNFLGVVINHMRRIDKTTFDYLKATLFGACIKSLSTSARQYFEQNPTSGIDQFGLINGTDASLWKIEKFTSRLRGKISYMKHINRIHHNQALKLLNAAEILHLLEFSAYEYNYHEQKLYYDINRLKHYIFKIVKQYKNDNESLENFLRRMIFAIIWNDLNWSAISETLNGTKFAALIDGFGPDDESKLKVAV